MARMNPIFRSPLYAHPMSNGGVCFPQERPKPPSSKPKVVSIPVHYVNSDNDNKKTKTVDRSAAAIKIQKAFRGFMVKKNVKIVRKIEAEVEEIERKMKTRQEMDLIAGDSKERLKKNEMLMSLLLRLDSVRGVRDYRRRVIRRVIMLQELLDSMSAARSAADSMEAPADGETPAADSMDSPLDAEAVDAHASAPEMPQVEERKTLEIGEQSSMPDSMDVIQDAKPETVTGEAKTLEIGEERSVPDSMDVLLDTKSEAIVEEATSQDSEEQSTMCDQTPTMEQPQDEEAGAMCDRDQDSKVADCTLETGSWEMVEVEEPKNSAEDEESPMVEESIEEPVASAVGSAPQETTNNLEVKDVMDRMAAENVKLKGLVVELCKRNAEQCKLMGKIAERVEHLEKAVKKMEKKKRKENSSLGQSLSFL